MYIFDSLQNLVSGMGRKGKSVQTTFAAPLLLTHLDLLNAYRGDWIARKVVNIPAFDMVRAWRDLQADAKSIEAIETEERRLQIRAKVLKALKWARLFGGSAIILGVNQGQAREPLDVARLGKGALQFAHVVSRYEITAGEPERNILAEGYGLPTYYRMTSTSGGQADIHPSRVLRFGGEELPEIGRTDSWGDSVLLSVDEAVKNAGLTTSGIAALVQEAKVDVYKIKNLTQNVGNADYVKRLQTRVSLANEAKSIENALLMDAEEEWQQKTINFAQLPDVLRMYLQVAAGAADIPATRFLGQSPDGMNATGEGDLRNYYDRLSAGQDMDLRPQLEQLDEIMVRSAIGSRPADYYFEFAPLWQLSEKERADIFNIKATAARTLAGTGGASPSLMPIEALSDALVNTFVEDGSLPGLEAAIEEFGRLADQEEDTAALAAALPPPAKPDLKLVANDAAPRTLYVSRRLVNTAEVIAWAKGQGFKSTLPAEDLHVTVTFSRAAVDWMKMGDNWSGDAKGSITIPPGGPRLVEPLGDKGAVVLLFASSDLQWRHAAMIEAGASWDYPEYQPHLTLTYDAGDMDLSKVEPYRGELVFGPERFEELDEDWAAKVVEDGGLPGGADPF